MLKRLFWTVLLNRLLLLPGNFLALGWVGLSSSRRSSSRATKVGNAYHLLIPNPSGPLASLPAFWFDPMTASAGGQQFRVRQRQGSFRGLSVRAQDRNGLQTRRYRMSDEFLVRA